MTLDSVLGLLGFFSIVLTLFMQWQIYVTRVALTFALSSLLIAAALIYAGALENAPLVILLGILTAAVRGILIPVLVVNNLHVRPWRAREQRPVVKTATSILLSLLLVLVGYGLYRFALAEIIPTANGFLPFALFLQGGFLIISKRNAFIQLIGYLVTENAVLLLGSLVFPGLPLVIEAGVVLDLLGIVVVARIIMQMREASVEESGERFETLKG
jgi:hydrogenase-4 component E